MSVAALGSWKASLPLPPAELSPNARVHWGERRRVAHAYLTRCIAALREQDIFPPAEPWARAEIRLAFRVPRLGDMDNRIASIKALLDGLVRAGYFAGDDPDRLVYREWPEQTLAPRRECRLELALMEVA
jgi:crossover junction endodeoxyribonuclease RusA